MSIQDVYFSNSTIKLNKKVYLQRKYKIPQSNGWIYQEYEKMYRSNWSIYNSATGITFQDNKVIFNNVSVNGGITGKFGAVGSTPVIDSTKNAYIKVEIEIQNFATGSLLLAYGTVTDSGNAKFIRDNSRPNIYYALVCSPAILNNTDFILYSNDGFTGEITYGGAVGAKLYEDSWNDISDFLISKSMSTSKDLDVKSWEFGEIQQDNMQLNFLNDTNYFNDENDKKSIFYNDFTKHKSKIKLDIGLNNETKTIFEGLIDERACSTEVSNTALIIEKITVFSYIKLFSEITFAELGIITQQQTDSISKAVNVILNYGAFKYFIVSTNISVVRDLTTNILVYDSTTYVDEILKELSKGQSAYWLDENNVFHFRSVEANNTTYNFGISPERKIKLYDFSSGADRIIENFFWKDTSLKAVSREPKYNTSEEIDVKCITNSLDRKSLLDFLCENFSNKKISCKLDIPLSPFVQVFDKVQITTQKSKGISFTDKNFIVYGIKHNDIKTSLSLIEQKRHDFVEWKDIKSYGYNPSIPDSMVTNIANFTAEYKGTYIITLKGEKGYHYYGSTPSENDGYDDTHTSSWGNTTQYNGAILTIKLKLNANDNIKFVKIMGGYGKANYDLYNYIHAGCGIGVYVNNILFGVAGGGSNLFMLLGAGYTTLPLGGGGYYGGNTLYLSYSQQKGCSVFKNNTDVISEPGTLASGGSHKNGQQYFCYGGSGYINTESSILEESSYINGSDAIGQYTLGNKGAGYASIESIEQ